MTRHLTFTLLVSLTVLSISAHSDTLTLRNGTSVTGDWVGLDTRQLSFRVNGQVLTYPRSDVSQVVFGSAQAPFKPEKGQTTDQVTAQLGQPQVIAEVGDKRIYLYKDLKITFIDGKVTGVDVR